MVKIASKFIFFLVAGLIFTSGASAQNIGRVKAAVSTMPGEMNAGETITVTVTITNIGNETWSSAHFDAKELGPFEIEKQFTGEWTVEPGNTLNLNYSVTAPNKPGKHRIKLVFYSEKKKVGTKNRVINVIENNAGEVK